MKKLILLLAVVSTLSGCALYDAYFMAKYDSNEYQYLANIRTSAEIGQQYCKDQEASKATAYHIYYKSAELKNYSQFLPSNADAIKMTTNLFKETAGLYDRYNIGAPVSLAYCTNKLKLIERSAKEIQESTGARPR